MKILRLSLGLWLGLMACSGPDYLAEASFADGCWLMQDTLAFTLPPEAKAGAPLRIDLDLGADFRYENLYLKLRYLGPEGQVEEQLINQRLIDPVGNWLTERQGKRVAWTIEPAPHLPLSGSDAPQVQLFHFMRDSSLCEVYRVGIGIQAEKNQ
jgi:hypothetical protein